MGTIQPKTHGDKTSEPRDLTAEKTDRDVVDEIDFGAFDMNAGHPADYSDLSNPADYPRTPNVGDPAHSPTMYSKADEGSERAEDANPGENSGRGVQSTENKDLHADRVDETSKQIHCSHSPPTALTRWVPTEAQTRLFGRPAPSTNSGLGSDYDSKHPHKVEDESFNTDRLDQVSKQIERYRNPPTAFTAMPPTDTAIRLFGSPAPSTYSESDNDDNTKSASRPRLRLTFGQTCYTEDRINTEDEPETSTDSEDNDHDKRSSVPGPRLRLTFGPSCHTEDRSDTDDEFDTGGTIHLGLTNMSGNSPGPVVEEEMWSTEDNMTPSTEAKQCADEEIEELADHSITGHALDTADFSDTVSNASMTAMEHDQDLEVLPQQIGLGSLMLEFWFLLPAFLSLYFMDLLEPLVPWATASMTNLIPKDV
ncbi:MAG: hypothetical protein L6R38_003801 [Xanthoria sp. 2 TBL-2021]|nr:MAG: hypothetical protein L6R38_003801 [Xanthoria sp. 2 TBL-2021]